MIGSTKMKISPMFSNKPGLMRKMSLRRCDQQSSSPARRMVSFAPTDNQMETVTVQSIPALSDMSKEEIQNMWYDDIEFQMMKLAIVRVLRKMVAGTYMHDIEGFESETRGLESKTPKGSNARKRNRYASLFAVLDEQDRQREHGRTVDSEYIALLYRQSSAHCQMEAIQIAANDAKVAFDHQEQAISEPKVFQKMLPSPASPTPNRSSMACRIAPHKAHSRRRLLSMMICK